MKSNWSEGVHLVLKLRIITCSLYVTKKTCPEWNFLIREIVKL